MGGRANAGNTKMFSNVDAARNAPLRATRAKEIETNRATQAASVAKPKVLRAPKKIIETKGMVSIATRDGKRESIESLARSKDGMLHVNKGGKYSFHITDANSGMSIATVGSKKNAIKFLGAVTRPNGTASPTLKRYIEFSTTRKADFQALPKEKRDQLSRGFKAMMKMKARIGYD